MSDLTWTNERRRLSDLVPWEHNPRAIRKAEAERLADSWRRFGQPEVIAIGPGNEVYNGHQRLAVWAAEFGDVEVDVRVASRSLTERERQQLTVYLHAGATGGWSWDDLAGWDMGDLSEWGFDGDLLKAWNDDAANLALMLEAEQDAGSFADAMGALPDGERAPFQQMTFTLHDDQVETVKAALATSKGLGEFVATGNENSNGNALARICELFLGQYGQGQGD